jgi:MFS family permease
MLPLWGFAADRFSRKSLLVGFTGFWGIWTLVISLVNTFPQLMIVRVLSALGLGVFVPAAFSLVGDLFDNRERGRAAGIMTGVGIIGSIVAFAVLPALADASPEGWRNGFIVMGIASVLTGLLLLFIKEPTRGASEPELRDVVTSDAASRFAIKWSDVRRLAKIRSWWLILIFEVLSASGGGLLAGWAFTWLDTLELGESAIIIVLLMALGSIGGAMFFGWLSDLLEQRFPNNGRLALIFVGLLTLLPTTILLVTSTNENLTRLTILGFLFGLAASASGDGVRWPVTQAILPPELRGSGRAVIQMASGVIGAFMLTISGIIADQVGVATMLLMLIPLPTVLNIIFWLPIFRIYSQDRKNLHEQLTQRRAELLKE